MFSRLAFLKRIKAPNGGTYNLRKTATTTTTTTLSAVLPEQPIGFRFFASQIARRTSCFKPWPKVFTFCCCYSFWENYFLIGSIKSHTKNNNKHVCKYNFSRVIMRGPLEKCRAPRGLAWQRMRRD